MNALVVGLGRMGGFHAKVLHELGYDVITVDPDPAKNADHRTIAEARLVDQGWITKDFDIACVAVPIPHLVETAYQLAGTPHILVEKPFAPTSREAAMLAAYLKQSGSKVCVGYVERFNPVVREHRDQIRELRDVRSTTFTRWSNQPTVDPALDLTVHDIDLARHLGRGAGAVLEFDTRAPASVKRRSITIHHRDGTLSLDLMAHTSSPLHALWHAFLTDQPHPTPEQAVHTLQWLERREAYDREQTATQVAA